MGTRLDVVKYSATRDQLERCPVVRQTVLKKLHIPGCKIYDIDKDTYITSVYEKYRVPSLSSSR